MSVIDHNAIELPRISEASVADYIALLKPRVMSLVIFTALVGLVIAPGHVHPILAFVKKEKAADNPWGVGATTLEWTLPSPPPFHQFEVLPRVQ